MTVANKINIGLYMRYRCQSVLCWTVFYRTHYATVKNAFSSIQPLL